jgi:hypothetical protein
VPRVALAATLLALALLLPSTAAAAPRLCSADVVQQALIDTGKLTAEDVGFGVVVGLVRCGDITADGRADALFTLASGGTAGDTRFGVFRGTADGSPGRLVLWRQGYKVGVARHNRRSFDVLQPHYDADDANCCPSSFRQRRFTWTGRHFRRGHKAKHLKHPPRRFYRP